MPYSCSRRIFSSPSLIIHSDSQGTFDNGGYVFVKDVVHTVNFVKLFFIAVFNLLFCPQTLPQILVALLSFLEVSIKILITHDDLTFGNKQGVIVNLVVIPTFLLPFCHNFVFTFVPANQLFVE